MCRYFAQRLNFSIKSISVRNTKKLDNSCKFLMLQTESFIKYSSNTDPDYYQMFWVSPSVRSCGHSHEMLEFTMKFYSDKSLVIFRFAEKVVLAHFVILALLWLTRDPGFVPGWGYGFKKGWVKSYQYDLIIIIDLRVISKLYILEYSDILQCQH